jgi:hypothetical protein
LDGDLQDSREEGRPAPAPRVRRREVDLFEFEAAAVASVGHDAIAQGLREANCIVAFERELVPDGIAREVARNGGAAVLRF